MEADFFESWATYRDAFAQVLASAQRQFCVFDDDLTLVGLQQPENAEMLRQLLVRQPPVSVRIALRDTSRLRECHPRLMPLLRHYEHALQICAFPDLFIETRACFFLADAERALIRFDAAHPRAKLVWDNSLEVAPYVLHFEQLWKTADNFFLPEIFGL